jgi:predicted glutamine amidotransferase
MAAGEAPVRASFWMSAAPLPGAPSSRRNPDGYGLATSDTTGSFWVEKRTAGSAAAEQLAGEWVERESLTCVAHFRYASEGDLSPTNTHPFDQKHRMFAHSGHVSGLSKLEWRLGSYRWMLGGATDSERFFALITKETDSWGGDVGEGIIAATHWIARELPLSSLNFVLATATELWALRYPDTYPLMMLARAAGGPTGGRHLEVTSPGGMFQVQSADLRSRAAVIFASERLDDDPGWTMLEPGELVCVNHELRISNRVVINRPPTNQIMIGRLSAHPPRSHGAATPEG